MKIHIAFAADEKYVPHMGVAMTSILVNSSESDEFFFHVISDSISAQSRSKILSLLEIKYFELEILEINDVIRGKIDLLKDLARRSHFAASSYYRLMIGSIFNTLEKILYLDCDIVVQGSLCDLWETDLSFHTIAVVLEPELPVAQGIFLDTSHYFNSGMMLFNLARWRSMGYEDKCMEIDDWILKRTRYPDQDILNYVFREGDILNKNIEYNYLVCFQQYMNDKNFCGFSQCKPVIIHYAGTKPWEVILDIFSQNSPRPRIFSHYWEYRSISPWGNERFNGVLRWKEIFRYLARHPKEVFFVKSTVKNWRKGIYRY